MPRLRQALAALAALVPVDALAGPPLPSSAVSAASATALASGPLGRAAPSVASEAVDALDALDALGSLEDFVHIDGSLAGFTTLDLRWDADAPEGLAACQAAAASSTGASAAAAEENVTANATAVPKCELGSRVEPGAVAALSAPADDPEGLAARRAAAEPNANSTVAESNVTANVTANDAANVTAALNCKLSPSVKTRTMAALNASAGGRSGTVFGMSMPKVEKALSVLDVSSAHLSGRAMGILEFEPRSGGVMITDGYMSTYQRYLTQDEESDRMQVHGETRARGSHYERWQHISSAMYERWQQQPAAGGRVVAVTSTTPSRIKSMQRAVDSIILQRFPLDAIYVFVPFYFSRDNSTYTIPDWLNRYSDEGKVILHRCDDLGPATPVLAVLELERDASTMIFKFDDDMLYSPNTVLMLMNGASVLPGRALTVESQSLRHVHGVVLETVHGVMFRRGWFDETLLDFKIAGPFDKYCRLQDDLWFTMHLAKKGIRRESLDLRRDCCMLESASTSDALSAGGAKSDNFENFYLCNAAVLQSHPDFWVHRPRVVVVVPARGPDALRLALEGLDASHRLPDQLYLCGAVGWAEFHHGHWYKGCVVTPLPDCPAEATAHDLLHVGARREHEPGTVLIAGQVEDLLVPTFVEFMAGCVAQGPLSDENQHNFCSTTSGAYGAWRSLLALPGERSWDLALERPLFEPRGQAQHRPLPQRVAVVVLPVREELLGGLSAEERRHFEGFSFEYNLLLVEAQSLRPSAVYFVSYEPRGATVTADSWGFGGFEGRTLVCRGCREKPSQAFLAAAEVEPHPNTLIIVVAAERLLDDQLVMRQVSCARRLLWGKAVFQGFCGSPSRQDRIVEAAVLQQDVALFYWN